MKTKTKSAALAASVARLTEESTVLGLALHDVASGAVRWFGGAAFRLGVSRPRGAAGGVVVVIAYGSTSADYWERFVRNQREHIDACVTGEDSEHNRELMERRRTIDAAAAYIVEVNQS